MLYIPGEEMEVHQFEGTISILFAAADSDFAGEDVLAKGFVSE